VIILRAIIYFPHPKIKQLCEQSSHHNVINNTALIDRFIESIKFKTITKAPKDYDRNELIKFSRFITKSMTD